MKIVMSEVTAAKTSIESSKTKLQSQINSAKSSWKGVVSSDGLSGSVKLAIDAEINNYQMPLLTNYYDAMHQLSTEFTKAISDFKSTVKETSGSAIIDTDALTTAESKFSDQLTKFTEIEAKFKTVYSSISDLVSVSEVSGSGFTEEMEKTKKVLTNTKTWMATFNGKKSSKAISSILSQQKAQIKSLKGVAGLSYTDPKSLEIYQNKAFKNKVSKQHKAVKEFEKKKLEAERAELLRKHPAILAIHGQIDKEYNAKIAREINDKNYKKTKYNKEDIVLVKETDSLDEIFRKYRELSKLGIHPHTGEKLNKEGAKWFNYSGWAMPIQDIAGQVVGAYAWKKVGDFNSSSAKKATKNNVPNNSKNSAQYKKYKNELIKGDVIENSKSIISGTDLKDPKVISELTKNGSPMSDWAKMESIYEYETTFGKGKVHYYKNLKTGEISSYDTKIKISIPKDLRERLHVYNDFWLIELDENFVPKGVK